MGAGVLLLAAAAAGAGLLLLGKHEPTWHELTPDDTIKHDEWVWIAFDAPDGWDGPSYTALLTLLNGMGFDSPPTGLPPTTPKGEGIKGRIGVEARYHGDTKPLGGLPASISAPPAKIPTANFRMYSWR